VIIVLQRAASVFLWLGDLLSADEYIERLMSLTQAHSFGEYLATAKGFTGQLTILRGDVAGGIAHLRACLRGLESARYEMLTAQFCIWLAEGLRLAGQFDESLALVDEMIGLVEANGAVLYLPELLRVKGGLLLAMPASDEDGSETCLREAIGLSRHHGTRAWELRIAVDLAALLAARGEPENASAILRPIFEQFREGLYTADLKAAAGLLATFD
jgi:ATP/maltotriose-dependent transcriptional regulator MalT